MKSSKKPPTLRSEKEMKLELEFLRFLTQDGIKILEAVEISMRNSDIVPLDTILNLAQLKHGSSGVLTELHKHKLLHKDSSKCNGYRLTYLGYDYLAIKKLVKRGVIAAVGRQIGVGKEADIFEVATEDGTLLAMKLHRLGRTSFRAVKSKRDYLRRQKSFNWMDLSGHAARKEFAFMKALGEHGFPVPTAVDYNRHCVVMSLVHGYPLVQVKELPNPYVVFETLLGIVVRLAEHGLIHCDFNEFNIMIDDSEKITMIDFPQMVSVSHYNAKMYFDRDVDCIYTFFKKRFNLSWHETEIDCDDFEVEADEGGRPQLCDITNVSGFLDKDLEASGFTRTDLDDMDKFIVRGTDDESGSELEGTEGEDEAGIVVDEASPENFDSSSSVINVEIEHALEDDPQSAKQLRKQRKQAIKALCRTRKASAVRNSNKDKGRKSSNVSKNQLSSWS